MGRFSTDRLRHTGQQLRESYAICERRLNYVYDWGEETIKPLGEYTGTRIMHQSSYMQMQTSPERLTACGLQAVLSFLINIERSFIGGVKDKRLWPSQPQTQNSTLPCLQYRKLFGYRSYRKGFTEEEMEVKKKKEDS